MFCVQCRQKSATGDAVPGDVATTGVLHSLYNKVISGSHRSVNYSELQAYCMP